MSPAIDWERWEDLAGNAFYAGVCRIAYLRILLNIVAD
jgi:hypothetical protein